MTSPYALPAVVGSGYALPDTITVAPGQLITLIIEQGLGNIITPSVQAPAGANLPTTLGGFLFGFSQVPGAGYSLPILQVRAVESCPINVFPYACNELAAITVQIPFEALPILPQPCVDHPGATCIPGASIGVGLTSDPNAQNPSVTVAPLADQVHILTACDPFMSTATYSPLPTGFPCPPIVAHGDGSTVSATNPAKAGEELVAYAVGLGQTNPASVTGQLVTKSAPTVITYILDYNYHPNALPSRPLPGGPQPTFAGTTPGYVGLYQINFVVPPVPAGTPACVDASTLPLGSNVVQSNLTVSIGGQFSFDGTRICVATQ